MRDLLAGFTLGFGIGVAWCIWLNHLNQRYGRRHAEPEAK